MSVGPIRDQHGRLVSVEFEDEMAETLAMIGRLAAAVLKLTDAVKDLRADLDLLEARVRVLEADESGEWGGVES